MIGNLTSEEIEILLTNNILGRLACNDNLRNYIVPVNYLYSNKSILIHSRMGLKIEMMRKNPHVCFQVDEIENMNKWKSVIIWGLYQELTDEKEKYEAMDTFVKRMMHLKISETAKPPETSIRLHTRSPGNIEMVIYKIIPEKKTGRYEM